jgi:hypothetical protein
LPYWGDSIRGVSIQGFDAFSEILGLALDAVLLCMILFRKPARQVWLFGAYLIFLICREVWWDVTFSHLPAIYDRGYHVYYVVYWASDFLLSVLRLATCVQIWWLSVRRFPSIWKLTWRVLAGVSGVLCVWCAASALSHTDKLVYFFYIGIERFEFMQATVLVMILAFALYYSVFFQPGYRVFLTGLCIYSLAQCAITSLSVQHPTASYEWFSVARSVSFWLVLAMSIYALAKLAPQQEFQLSPESEHTYARLSPVVNYRLQVLNERLAEMLHL